MAAPASKSHSAREPDSRPQEIVKAAYMQIADVGLEGLRTRDVAARVGINIATLHYHFASKEELVLAVVRHVNHLFQTLRAPLVEGGTLIDHMIRTFRHRRQVAPELQLVVTELSIRGARDPVVAKAMGDTQQEWRSWMEQQLRAEIASGLLRADLDAKKAAALLASITIGSSVQLQANASALDFETLMRHVEEMLRAEPTKKKKKAR